MSIARILLRVQRVELVYLPLLFVIAAITFKFCSAPSFLFKKTQFTYVYEPNIGLVDAKIIVYYAF